MDGVTNNIQKIITEAFGDKVCNFRMEDDIYTLEVSPLAIKELIHFLKENAQLSFNFLTDLCGVHYPENTPDTQFCVVYLLDSWTNKCRLRLKTFIGESNPELPTISHIFAAANWMERETFDFYGIRFQGHPNLKRILNDEAMESFPMRKDHPLEDAGRSDKDDRFFGRTVNNSQPQ